MLVKVLYKIFIVLFELGVINIETLPILLGVCIIVRNSFSGLSFQYKRLSETCREYGNCFNKISIQRSSTTAKSYKCRYGYN